MAAKDFLYSWLGKHKKVAPLYNIEQTQRGGVLRFKCDVRVPGYSYVGMGNSTKKKDAQTNAANDFLNFLVRNGDVPAGEAPVLVASSLEATSTDVCIAPETSWNDNGSHVGAAGGQEGWSTASTSSSGFFSTNQEEKWPPGDQMMAPPQLENRLTHRDLYVTQRAEEVAQSEAVDLKAEIHGGWTVDNSKSALNEFMQKLKQPPVKYVTEMKEAGGSNGFCTTLNCYIPHLRKSLHAEGRASTKKMAEAHCAMSMVRQLFHMKLMSAFQGKRKRISGDNIPPIVVNLDDSLYQRMLKFLTEMGITPAGINLKGATATDPQNLLLDHRLAHFEDSEISPPCNVSWSPPQQNWNPWRSCNIDEPPLALMNLQEISEKITTREAGKVINEAIKKVREELPVIQFREEIIQTVAANRVLLIKGETGCGKSTQVAQYLLESYIERGKGAEFNAFVSQPRRISAISLAERVANERGEDIGESVGYGVRFDSVSPRPYGAIFFCTVGVLLRKMESGLRGVSHVIIDEIHERDIDTDFVLVVLREMMREFPDLRVILMSATINSAIFTEYFGNCPVIEMQGRTHEVKRFFLEDILQITQFLPPDEGKRRDEEEETGEDEEGKQKNLNILPEDAPPMLRQAMSRINENDIPLILIEKILLDIHEKGKDGAVLIFLPGWQEIMNVLTHLSNQPLFGDQSQFVILPLHSQLTGVEQRRVFEHFPERRKIILSTNIAETSVTIDDVVYVIDSCKQRERLYSTTNNMVHYATVWASRSNLKQRCGRAGRVRPGFAFHLCSKQRFEALDEHGTAEILRTPLTAVALTIKLLRLGSVGDFLAKAIEPPPVDMVVEAEAVLQSMGALDRNLELTPLGRILAKLPIEPMMGKTIILAASFGIGSLMCELAAASSFSTPFVPRDRNHTRLSGAQRSFAGTRWSDHIGLISVNQQFAEASEQGSNSEQSFCQRFSLNMSMLKMTRGACNQLLDTLSNAGFPPESLSLQYANVSGCDNSLDLLTSLIVAAYYPNVGFYKGKRKLYTLEQATALVTKMSIITPFKGDNIELPSPLVVFSEKVRSRFVQCKEITVLNAFQLLLFGSRKVECIGSDLVRLDEMITLQMDPAIAAAVVALRPCVEGHLIRTCINPQSLASLAELDAELIQIIRSLSSPELFSWKGDYLLTDSVLQSMQSVNQLGGNFPGRRRGRERGGGANWRGGERSNDQWGFGGGAGRGAGNGSSFYAAGPPTPGYGSSYANSTPLGGGGSRGGGNGFPALNSSIQSFYSTGGPPTPGYGIGNGNPAPLGYSPYFQQQQQPGGFRGGGDGGGKWAWSRGRGGRGRGRGGPMRRGNGPYQRQF